MKTELSNRAMNDGRYVARTSWTAERERTAATTEGETKLDGHDESELANGRDKLERPWRGLNGDQGPELAEAVVSGLKGRADDLRAMTRWPDQGEKERTGKGLSACGS